MSNRLRYRLARPWLSVLRATRALGPVLPPSFRILILHDTPPQTLGALDRLVRAVKRGPGIISPPEAEAWIEWRVPALPPRPRHDPCLFSFDDGFASNVRAAQDILAYHGVKALFFVCPGLMELEPDQQRCEIAARIFGGGVTADALDLEMRLMTWDDVRQLRATGHTVGAHGHTHLPLTSLSGTMLEREIANPARLLAERLGVKPHWFAFPFGTTAHVSAQALAVVARHYRFCRSGVRGPNGAGVSRYALRADAIDPQAPDAWRDLIIQGGLDFRYRGARRILDRVAPGERQPVRDDLA